jgi:membrane protease YdiL (CAAX protease family)
MRVICALAYNMTDNLDVPILIHMAMNMFASIQLFI